MIDVPHMRRWHGLAALLVLSIDLVRTTTQTKLSLEMLELIGEFA